MCVCVLLAVQTREVRAADRWQGQERQGAGQGERPRAQGETAPWHPTMGPYPRREAPRGTPPWDPTHGKRPPRGTPPWDPYPRREAALWDPIMGPHACGTPSDRHQANAKENKKAAAEGAELDGPAAVVRDFETAKLLLDLKVSFLLSAHLQPMCPTSRLEMAKLFLDHNSP